MAPNKTRDLIISLDYQSALKVLDALCDDPATAKRIRKMAMEILKGVNEEEIINDVYSALNAIDVHDLWRDSGKTYHGYNDPTDVAWDMLETAVWPYVQEVEKYHDLAMVKEEAVYCFAIVKGLFKYANEGGNEFQDWVPDGPETLADNIFEEWAERNPDAEKDRLREELGL